MMTLTLSLFVFSAVGGVLSYWLIRQLGAAKHEIEELEQTVRRYDVALKARDKAIEAMQEAYKDAEKKKRALRTGDDAVDFQRSVDLLRDVPGESGAD